MTSQEQQLIDEFLQRLAAVHGVVKDAQVDALINQRLAGQPDALYLLVQRSLLLERALNDAKQQIAQLQQAAPHGDAGGASFLNAGIEPGFGRAPSTPGLYPTQPASPQQMETPMRQEAPGWRERLFGAQAAAPAPIAPVAQPSSAPSFLGTAASAAAGVAGGMFLYSGIQSMMHGNHANNGNGNGLFDMGSPSSSSLSQQPAVVENITQNYYGSDQTGGSRVDTGNDFLRDDGGGWTDASDGGSDFFDDNNIV